MRIKIKDLPPDTKVKKDELKKVMGGGFWGDVLSFFSTTCTPILGESSLEDDYSKICYDASTDTYYHK